MLLLFAIFQLAFYTSKIESLKSFEQSECGKSKSCLRWSSCDFANCDFGFSWKIITNNSTKYLEIEMVGTLTKSANGYLSLGFSLNQKMVDNGVVACHIENGQFGISASYNLNHKNEMINNVESDFFVKFLNDSYGVEYDSQHNILRCRFLRLLSPKENVEKLKDLSSNRSYYLLTAKSNIINGTIKYHFSHRRSSLFSYDLSSTSWINNIIPSIYLLTKCHACLMVFGWVFCATNGIIIANFYKNNWSKQLLFGKKIWFQLHQLIQSICVLCVSAGFIIIFIHVGGYSRLRSLPNSAHPILGIVSTGFMLANLIMAFFRCSPNHPSRWIFNRSHFLVGITAYVLALITIAIGIKLSPAGPNLADINYPWILVAIYLVLIVILFIGGEICSHLNKRQKITDSINLKENTDTVNAVKEFQNNESSNFVLIASLVISFGFGIAFIAIILLN